MVEMSATASAMEAPPPPLREETTFNLKVARDEAAAEGEVEEEEEEARTTGTRSPRRASSGVERLQRAATRGLARAGSSKEAAEAVEGLISSA